MMNNNMLINLALISISWCSLSYGQYVNYHWERVDNLYIYGAAAKVIIDKHNTKDVTSYQATIGTQVNPTNGLNTVLFNITGDTTITLPDDHPINKTIYVDKGKLDIIGGWGDLTVRKKEGELYLNPDQWTTTDIIIDKGDVTLWVDKAQNVAFDISVKEYKCMQNLSSIDLAWSYSWFWARWKGQRKTGDVGVPSVKVWAKNGKVTLSETSSKK